MQSLASMQFPTNIQIIRKYDIYASIVMKFWIGNCGAKKVGDCGKKKVATKQSIQNHSAM